MNTFEQAPQLEEVPYFSIEAFGMGEDFDINAAFQEAIQGVASDAELALDEKVRRMEVIVSESSSDLYRDFIDFRQMAAQMEMMCMHDHAFNQAAQGNDTLSSFMGSHKEGGDGHNHRGGHGSEHNHKSHDKEKKMEKKKKKGQTGWLALYLKGEKSKTKKR